MPHPLGLIADERGQRDDAISLFGEALALFQTLPDKNWVAIVYDNLANVAVRRQQYYQAITLYEKSLEIQHTAGNQQSIAGTLGNLGFTLYLSGNLSRALELMEASLAMLREADEILARITSFGEIDAPLRAERYRQRQHAHYSADTRNRLRGPLPSTQNNPGRLTNQQLEVLRLLVEGLRNAEIAAALQISPKTVEHHVSVVLAKLNVRSRAQAITQAHKLGIFAQIGERM